MDIGWTLRRLRHLTHRLTGSLAIRGWRGTLRRVLSLHRGAHDESSGDHPVVIAPLPGDGATRRILVIDSLAPDPTRDSGSARLMQIFALLRSDGWSVDFIADDAPPDSHDIHRLAMAGVRTRRGSARRWLSEHGADIDVVMLCRLAVMDQYLPLVRKHARRAIVVFDTVDLHFIREERAAFLTGSQPMVRRAARSRERELALVRGSDVTFVVSEEERNILSREVPGARIERVSNIHEVVGRGRGFASRRDMVFVGGFGHPPNEDAVRWFAAEVMPLLRREEPSIALHVVGDIHSSVRRSLAHEGLILHGRVDDLSTLLDGARISVAPLRFGAGVKGKVNQAMSHGLPVVVTTIAAEGMHLRNGIDAMIADDAEAMASAIIRLYRDPDLWLRLSDAGMENVAQHFSLNVARQALRNALGVASI